MELALYCPNSGYYERPDTLVGRRGDFFTSVSIGSLFGELLAHRFALWLASTPGSKRQILEAGGHDGRLAADILKCLQEQQPDAFETLEYWLLEPSPNRRAAQKKMLGTFSGKVRWFESWDVLPADGVRGVIFSNELLDAMPVRRAGWDAAQKEWFEWGVALSGEKFIWIKMPADDELLTEIISWNLPPGLLQVLPDGFTTEVGQAAMTWWRRAASCLKEGKLLTFDYGLEREEFFAPERKEGTLRAYYRHHLETDLLARPGEQDITAQVDFTGVREVGSRAGLGGGSLSTQEQFLTRLLQEISRVTPSGMDWARWSRAFQTLIHPEHLGRSFRVLLQER